MDNKKYLVTSALLYVNNYPHLGNLVCVISADVYFRYLKLRGKNAIYVLGTDEHGTTAEVKAREEGVTPKQLVNKYFKIHKKIYDWFNVCPDVFGRTSSKTNYETTIDIFNKLNKNGFIFDDTVRQAYCSKCKKYLSDRYVEGECPHCGSEHARGDQCEDCGKLLDALELVNPKCSVCGKKPDVKTTQHLFLDLPKISPQLKKWVVGQGKKGNWSKNAITMTNAWLKEGLKPRCITRDIKWGIPVPLKGFEKKVFYSWFDAPIGYISIVRENLKDWHSWWHEPKNVKLMQFMGKDNIPFHTILFPSYLIGAKDNYVLLDQISSNEYLNYEGGQFSKSRHVGVFGDDAMKTGIKADLWRYYIMVNRPEKADTDFSWEDFQSKVNHEVLAALGNLVNRVVKFLNKFYDGKVPAGKLGKRDKEFLAHAEEKYEFILALQDEIKIKDGLREIMNLCKLGNQYFQDKEPWKAVKSDEGGKESADTALFVLANLVKDIALLIKPFMPDISEGIEKQINFKSTSFDELGELSIKAGHKVGIAKVLVEKLLDEDVKKFKEKFSSNKKGDGDKKGKIKKNEQKQKSFDVSKAELRVAKVIEVKDHPDADSLYVMKIDVGSVGKRKIVSGLKDYFSAKELVGKKIVVVCNLKPAKLRGVKSNGMLLAASKGKKLVLVEASGSKVGSLVSAGVGGGTKQKQINIEDFAKIDFKVKGKKVFVGADVLKTSAEKVVVDISDGARIS